jgi:hypothetical protein
VISTLDTTSTAGPDTVIDASISVPGANYMLYDGNENRLYIPAGTNLVMLDVSQSVPSMITGAPITACDVVTPSVSCIATVSPSARSTSDPCAATTAVTALDIVSVASLPDSSRAYVGAYYTDSDDNICPQVTEIDAVSNSVATSIPVPGFPDATNASADYYVPACTGTRDMIGPTGSGFRFTMAAGGDSSRVYFSSCDGGAVNIIDTSTESYGLLQEVPLSARPPVNGASQNPAQNPIFMLAGPP